ncbi:MAG: hypothetical protein AAGE18_13430 [Pseudomonadota bacterium]
MSFADDTAPILASPDDWPSGRGDRLKRDILRLRARAMRYGYVTTAEALHLAADVVELGSDDEGIAFGPGPVIAGK